MSSASPISTENHGGEPTHTAATSSAEATAAAAPAPAPTTASQEGNKVPLIVVGTEEHGPFVPPKLEDIHDVKPALKKHAVDGEVVMADATDVEGVVGEDGHRHDSHAKKALQWDEKAIEEHDLLRGTRMKIDEPKTPFSHHYDHEHHSDDDSAKHPRTPPAEDQLAHHVERASLDHGILERKLAGVAAVREFYPSSPSASSRDGGSVYSDEEEAKKKRQHEREFQMHRKHHYNEMEMLRRFREQHPGGLDDDDDDDELDDDDEKNGEGEMMEEG